MALMCTAEGVCHLEETIFENRFMHAPELIRMGASIDVKGGTATIWKASAQGRACYGDRFTCAVLLVLAGLAAQGETVDRVYHLDRGYEFVEEKLKAVGADVERIKGS